MCGWWRKNAKEERNIFSSCIISSAHNLQSFFEERKKNPVQYFLMFDYEILLEHNCHTNQGVPVLIISGCYLS
jgi:hypothetical protein